MRVCQSEKVKGMSVNFKSWSSRAILFLKNWSLPLAMASGVAGYFLYVSIPIFDSTHAFVNKAVEFIQPALFFAMLFLTFLCVGPRDIHLRRWHLWNILLQLFLFAGIAVLLGVCSDTKYRILLESAMLCLLAPTATAAAVVTRKLDGNPADVITYTVFINIAVAVSAPVLLPLAHPHSGMTFISAFLMIMAQVFPILIFPLFLAWGFRAWVPRLTDTLRQWKDLPFYIWCVGLSLAIAVTVKAIMHSGADWRLLGGIAVVSLVTCVFQFAAGKKIGERYGGEIESGQSLGQKNPVFIIWLAYTFLTPVTAMAGGMYSLCHNLYNFYQLNKARKRSESNKP